MPLEWEQSERGMVVRLGGSLPDAPAHAVAITPPAALPA
jgi:hypothetical protein